MKVQQAELEGLEIQVAATEAEAGVLAEAGYCPVGCEFNGVSVLGSGKGGVAFGYEIHVGPKGMAQCVLWHGKIGERSANRRFVVAGQVTPDATLAILLLATEKGRLFPSSYDGGQQDARDQFALNVTAAEAAAFSSSSAAQCGYAQKSDNPLPRSVQSWLEAMGGVTEEEFRMPQGFIAGVMAWRDLVSKSA